eukprot:Transcript_26150.p3 GENE.Transcript_26150~~Transcript_26150.p3  ORF type:complete len:183 (+),score=55.09 Transcript_26150:429-977(+)
MHSHCLINHIRHWCRHGSHLALCCPLCRTCAHTEGAGSGRKAIMWLPKARQTTRSREEEVTAARQTLLMFEQMLEMAEDMGDARMLEMAQELIADQRKSLEALLLEQQEAIVRAQARRHGAAPGAAPSAAAASAAAATAQAAAPAAATAAAAAYAEPEAATLTSGHRRSSRLSSSTGRPRPY